MATTAAAPAPPGLQIRLSNLWWVAGAIAVMTGAIILRDRWLLNFIHVFSGMLWTGIDLFLGFVLGPIMRQVELPVRRAIVLRLMPRMMFIMPTLSIVTGTSGWFLAVQLGYLDFPWPAFGWVAAALAITTLLAVLGIGILLPTNLSVCFEMQKATPDFAKIQRRMRHYLLVIAIQGVLQIAIVVIMARFVTGI